MNIRCTHNTYVHVRTQIYSLKWLNRNYAYSKNGHGFITPNLGEKHYPHFTHEGTEVHKHKLDHPKSFNKYSWCLSASIVHSSDSLSGLTHHGWIEMASQVSHFCLLLSCKEHTKYCSAIGQTTSTYISSNCLKNQ